MPGGISLAPKIALDPIPKLGGNLDLSSHKIEDSGVLQFYNDTANHRIVLNAASGNTSVVVAPSGTGAIMLSTDGNARGDKAIDLQINRNGDLTAVASGTNSILIGSCSKASGVNSCALGFASQATGQGSTAIGGVASGTASVTIGNSSVSDNIYTIALGYATTASGYASISIGYGALSNGDCSIALSFSTTSDEAWYSVSMICAQSYCPYQFSQSNGGGLDGAKAQTHILVESAQTSGTTPAELTLDGSSTLILPTKTSWAFRMLLVGRSTDGSSINAAWNIFGCIKRDLTADSTAIVGDVQYGTPLNSPGWSCLVSADITTGGLKIQVTGQANKIINWSARVEITEISESM